MKTGEDVAEARPKTEAITERQETRQKETPVYLRSEEVNEILGKPPGWIVRWGTAVLFMVIAITLAGSYFFSYPDIVRASLVLTRENPPSVLIARTAGKPGAMFFPDATMVRKGDTLAVIENPARYRDIFMLGRYLNSLTGNFMAATDTELMPLPENLILGEVQPAFNEFASAWHDYRMFINQDFYDQKIRALSAELSQYIIYRENLERQRALVVREMELGTSRFRRDSALYISNVISESEFENAQTELLNKLKAVEASKLALSDAGIIIARLERAIADARLEKEERNQKLLTSFVNTFRQLESLLAAWENKYLIIASTSGILSYLSVWSNLQEVGAGEPVFSIVPEDMGELHARIIVPFRRAGKVRPGQRVNIKLDGYPFMEYGMMTGHVLSISGGPVENGFPAVVKLSGGVSTSFGYNIEVVRELPGIAEISTEERSLFERLLSPVRHLVKSRIITENI
jgi:multidrug efflux pump subunit AcrA (membrane-fusion protein)